MRFVAISLGALLAAISLLGCASLSGPSYVLDAGDANYDALKRATQACEARHGQIELRKGYDGRDLSNYECAIGKAD